MQQQNVQEYLKGCQFPCYANDIERTAKNNDAPQDVLQSIRNLPNREFRNKNEVQEALSQTATT